MAAQNGVRRDFTPYATRIKSAVFGNAFPPLAALASQPILAQALGADGRGLAAAAVAPLLLATSAATLGLPEAVTHAVARNRSALGSSVMRASIATLISAAVAILGIVFASDWLSAGNADLARLIVIVAFALVPTVLVGVARGAAAGLHEWKMVAAERAVNSGARLIALVVLLLSGQLTVTTAALTLALTPVVGGLTYLLLAKRAKQLPEPATQARSTLPELLSFGLRVWIGAISGILLMRLDQTLMNPLAGAIELGFYVVAVAVSEVPLIVNGAIRDVTFASESSGFDRRRVERASRVSTIAAFFIALVIAASMWLWLPILFGEEFSPAIPVALVLLAAVVMGNPGSVAGAGLSALGRPGLRSISLLIACLVNVVIMIALVPALGAMGAAVATLVGNLISSNLNIIMLSKVGGTGFFDFYKFARRDVKDMALALVKRRHR